MIVSRNWRNLSECGNQWACNSCPYSNLVELALMIECQAKMFAFFEKHFLSLKWAPKPSYLPFPQHTIIWQSRTPTRVKFTYTGHITSYNLKLEKKRKFKSSWTTMNLVPRKITGNDDHDDHRMQTAEFRSPKQSSEGRKEGRKELEIWPFPSCVGPV